MAFQKAVKRDARLRMSISGPSGSGKTWTALTLATRLANGEQFAVLDTERGSASKYADDFSFDVMEIDNFDPRNYVKAIKEAEEAGYTVMVIDSLTHAWNGTGGLLDIVDAIAKRKYGNNTFAAWKDATPLQNALIDAITGSKMHLLVTMRSKQEYAQEKNEKTGRTEIKKLGMAPIQRDGFEYELDVAVDMDIDNTMIVQKSRCSKLSGQIVPKPDGKVADILKEWLHGAPAVEMPVQIQSTTQENKRTFQPVSASAGESKPAEANRAQASIASNGTAQTPKANRAVTSQGNPEVNKVKNHAVHLGLIHNLTEWMAYKENVLRQQVQDSELTEQQIATLRAAMDVDTQTVA